MHACMHAQSICKICWKAIFLCLCSKVKSPKLEILGLQLSEAYHQSKTKSSHRHSLQKKASIRVFACQSAKFPNSVSIQNPAQDVPVQTGLFANLGRPCLWVITDYVSVCIYLCEWCVLAQGVFVLQNGLWAVLYYYYCLPQWCVLAQGDFVLQNDLWAIHYYYYCLPHGHWPSGCCGACSGP